MYAANSTAGVMRMAVELRGGSPAGTSAELAAPMSPVTTSDVLASAARAAA